MLCARNSAAAVKIGDLAAEHRETAARAREFRDAVRSVLGEEVLPRERFVQAARGFIDAERRHMKMEETIFFPAAQKSLSATDWQEIGKQLKEERDPVFGEIAEEEYRILRERLLAWEKDYKPG